MCCAEFIAKYALFLVNLVFSVLAVAVIGFSTAALVSLKDLDEILPVSIIPIGLIVLGSIVFIIAFLACCGAIRESRCMLIAYAIVVAVLAAFKIWLTVVVLGGVGSVQASVDEWLVAAFSDEDLKPVFHVLETSFRCCGTTGVNSYTAAQEPIPLTCCADPDSITQCAASAAYPGCQDTVAGWFDSVGGSLGGVLIAIIVAEVVAIILALFFSHTIKNKRSKINC